MLINQKKKKLCMAINSHVEKVKTDAKQFCTCVITKMLFHCAPDFPQTFFKLSHGLSASI